MVELTLTDMWYPWGSETSKWGEWKKIMESNATAAAQAATSHQPPDFALQIFCKPPTENLQHLWQVSRTAPHRPLLQWFQGKDEAEIWTEISLSRIETLVTDLFGFAVFPVIRRQTKCFTADVENNKNTCTISHRGLQEPRPIQSPGLVGWTGFKNMASCKTKNFWPGILLATALLFTKWKSEKDTAIWKRQILLSCANFLIHRSCENPVETSFSGWAKSEHCAEFLGVTRPGHLTSVFHF